MGKKWLFHTERQEANPTVKKSGNRVSIKRKLKKTGAPKLFLWSSHPSHKKAQGNHWLSSEVISMKCDHKVHLERNLLTLSTLE